MPGILHFARKSLEIAERRTQNRTLVTPPIYANIENLNGGLVYNMSEDGLALSAALKLGGEGPLDMQIHLPDSGGPVEATGQIAWKSESGRTVGIRFVALTEETRLRIRSWLASESSLGAPQSEEEKFPQQGPRQARVAPKTALFPLPDPMESGDGAEHLSPEQANSADSSVLNDEPLRVAAQPTCQPTEIASESLVDEDSSPQPLERRAFPRWTIRPFRYIELGQDNGGVLLNISESGLAVTSARILAEDHLSNIGIQFAELRDWINVSGQIAWISESRKKAGIRFVNLTEEARGIIASQISLEQSSTEDHVQSVITPPPAAAIRADIPKIPRLEILKPVDTPSGIPLQEQWRAAVPSSLSLPSVPGDILPAAKVVAPRQIWKRSQSKPKPRLTYRPEVSRAASEQLRRLAAVLVLAAVVGLAIRWVAESPSVRHEVIGFIAENTKVLNKPAGSKVALPENKATDAPLLQSNNRGSQAVEFQPTPSEHDVNGSEAPLAPMHPQVRSRERSIVGPAVNNVPRRAKTPPLKSPPSKLSERAAVIVPTPAHANAPSQSVVSSPVQPAQIIATPAPSPSASGPSATASAEVVKEKELSPPPKQPVVPVTPTWSVSVSTDPYPSIRIPPDISSQKASRGSSLQIGRATSRVEPVYPEEAKRQGVEGTVKLHVVVGRDGTVQSAEPISGPTLLAKAASSAIREWHYAQTLLAGQPVETEQDVVVNFRLANPSISKN